MADDNNLAFSPGDMAYSPRASVRDAAQGYSAANMVRANERLEAAEVQSTIAKMHGPNRIKAFVKSRDGI